MSEIKIKVGIIGATGYAGAELVRLLIAHPNAEIAALSSRSYEGKRFSEIYPAFFGAVDDILTSEDAVIERSDVIFASLPHGLSEKIARKCIDKGKKLIDLGADFRLSSESDYKEWYGLDYTDKELHEKSYYMIPELMRGGYKGQPIIANPGCYPTSIALGISPIVKSGNFVRDSIVIDSKSGVTGAGRGLTQNTHYPDCNEAFGPYKVAAHRHTPEIEENIYKVSGEKVKVIFTPHLTPVNRGIVSTIYVTLKEDVALSDVYDAYVGFYKNEKFVRVLPLGSAANLKNVRMSNYADISLHKDARTNRLVIVAAIDNMVKGASGQAIQNMNVMFSLAEDTGLTDIAPSF